MDAVTANKSSSLFLHRMVFCAVGSIENKSWKYYLVSGLDVTFRLYQHFDDLRVPSGRGPVDRRPAILSKSFTFTRETRLA